MKLEVQYFLIFLSIFFAVSCSNPSSTDDLSEETVSTEAADEATEVATQEINEEPELVVPDSLKCDNQIVIGEGIVWRKDGAIKITNIFGFKCQPAIGESVLVLPRDPKLPPMSLDVTATVPRDDLNPGVFEWFEVELQMTNHQKYLDYQQDSGRSADFPVDVAIVYPVQEGAQIIPIENLDSLDYPDYMNAKDIKFAIDFNSDSNPEAIVAEFCCDETDLAKLGYCEYTCGETVLRNEDGTWKTIGTSEPL
jgi:hypothetical protein